MKKMSEKVVDDERLKESFSKLHPVCIALTKAQNVDNILKLKVVINSLDEQSINDLQEYILFPLRVLLKQPANRSEKLLLGCLECLHHIASHSRIEQWILFSDLFSSLCCCISVPNESGFNTAPLSEELKLEAVLCLTAIVRNASNANLECAYTVSSIPLLSHAVTVMLNIAQRESMRRLRTSAVEFLTVLALIGRSVDVSVRAACGKIFASFLPGIATALAKVITGDYKQGQALTCTAIVAWRGIVVLVLGDANLATGQDFEIGSASGDARYRELVVNRTKEWTEQTASNLKLLIDRIGTIANSPHWKIRLAMVTFADNLLIQCSVSLCSSVPTLLDVLVHATTDSNLEVVTEARRALVNFEACRLRDVVEARPLVELLEENVYSLATQLPTRMSLPDDEQKLVSIRLLKGYIQLLGSRIDYFLASDVHLRRLSVAIMEVLAFDCSTVEIVQERTTGLLRAALESAEQSASRPRNRFKCFADQRVEKEIRSICRLLGYYGNVQLLVDHFMDLLIQSSAHRKQAAYCIAEILAGVGMEPGDLEIPTVQQRTIEELESVIRLILEEILQPQYWKLSVTNYVGRDSTGSTSVELTINGRSTVTKNTRTIEQLNSNIILSCLLLDVVAHCASVLKAGFQPVLMNALYPVLEKAGSESGRVSESAIVTLRDVSRSCGYADVAAMLRANADYLVNSISMRLRHLQRHPEAPDVLRVMLRFSDSNILPLVDDLILEIFDTLDHHHHTCAPQFMSVLHALVSSILSWHPTPFQPSSPQPPSPHLPPHHPTDLSKKKKVPTATLR